MLDAEKDFEHLEMHLFRPDNYVPVSWEEVIDIVAFELNRIKKKYKNKAFFAGSYGWGSAGRLHHAQSQLHRFFNCYG